MQISAWCRTDKGLRRDSNQDSFLVNRSAGLFIVADGMGGHSGGEVASALAVATAEEYILKNRYTQILPHDLLTNAYKEASHHIYDKALQDTWARQWSWHILKTTLCLLPTSGIPEFICITNHIFGS